MNDKVGRYSAKDAEQLVKIARQAIASEFNGEKEKIKFPEGKQFKQARGVFVTLMAWPGRQLRGCIGFPEPTLPLAQAVAEAAKSAAFHDPRFFPMKKDEPGRIIIEISILTLPQKCNSKEIEVGKDGLVIDYVGYSGLLLPQVATEHKMSRIEFLEAICQKAGLPKDSWQNKNCALYRFQAQIFAEQEPNGEVGER
ncbi:TIGR00296 family protein [Candidatus Pacearchaeota archaeon]|nr:TIGR00296 family protein [Candidatus Pacearchaeota archaeon]